MTPSLLFQRLRRAIWTWKQPLTQQPSERTAPISDLFIWRASKDWQTSFELIDIPSLFCDYPHTIPRNVTIFFFDDKGRYCLEKRIPVLPHQRQTLNISSLVGESHGEVGTFAVFHADIPRAVTDMGSFLTERGYVSYRYQQAPLQAYVHGNYDAIARKSDHTFERLGVTGWLPRQYCLQHAMQNPSYYEFGLVNPTNKVQSFTCQWISLLSGKLLSHQIVKLPPQGMHLIHFPINQSEPARAVIQSRLVMARPLVFRIQNSKLDVFHG